MSVPSRSICGCQLGPGCRSRNSTDPVQPISSSAMARLILAGPNPIPTRSYIISGDLCREPSRPTHEVDRAVEIEVVVHEVQMNVGRGVSKQIEAQFVHCVVGVDEIPGKRKQLLPIVPLPRLVDRVVLLE